MIPSLWATALETDRRCFSKVILASNVTPNITRSADSFNTVPSRVNGVNWGWTVRYLETIIVIVLLAFSFIPHRSHHTLTLFRSRFQNGVVRITVTLVVHNREKLCSIQEEQLRAQNTSMRHPWHHVNKFAMTTIHHDILWPIREKLCQNRQQWLGRWTATTVQNTTQKLK